MCIYYTGYLTTNLINNKKYIGVHATEKPNDNYLGSGTALKRAVKKYGQTNFCKEVIAFMLNEEVMYEWEAENVTQEIVDDPTYYNIKLGGEGGSIKGARTGHIVSNVTRAKISAALKGRTGKKCSVETRAKLRAVKKGRSNGRLGKKHSEEHKAKISAAKKGKSNGHTGMTHSEETRSKMSEVHKNPSIETRAKMSTASKNRSAEHKAKLGAAQLGKKRKPLTAEHKAKISVANKGKRKKGDFI